MLEYLKKNLDNFFIIIPIFLFTYFWNIKFFNIDLRSIILVSFFYLIYIHKNTITLKKIIIFSISVVILSGHIYLINQTISILDLKKIFFIIIIIFIISYTYKIILSKMDKIIYCYIAIIYLSMLLAIIFLNKSSTFNISCSLGWFSINKFLYSENSHFGMTAGSVIAYVTVKTGQDLTKTNIFFMLLFLIATCLFISNSFLVGSIISIIFLIISNYKLLNKNQIFLFAGILVIYCSLLFNISSCKNRNLDSLDFFYKKFILNFIIPDKDNTIIPERDNETIKIQDNPIFKKDDLKINLSSSVHANSLLVAIKSFNDNLYGVGFDQYKKYFSKYIGDTSKTFDVYVPELLMNLNIEDASNNFSKMLSEFGLFNLVLVYLFLRFSFSKSIPLLFKSFLIPPILSQLLFRGAGYFNAGFIIFLSLMIFLVYDDYLQKKKLKKNNS